MAAGFGWLDIGSYHRIRTRFGFTGIGGEVPTATVESRDTGVD